MAYSYACSEYPGMEACPGRFQAATEDELWKHIELHAKEAHQENPAAWTADEREQIRVLVKVVE